MNHNPSSPWLRAQPSARAARRSLGRVLVTGATGFLGRHVLTVLRREQRETPVVGLARRPAGLPRHVLPIAGAVERPQTWAGHPLLDGVDTIVHLAARVAHTRRDATTTHAVNVQGTLTMVDLAARLGARLVLMSPGGTVGVFRSPAGWADEQSPLATDRVRRWPYYASKLVAEQRATRRCQDLGVELVVLRAPSLLGPDAPSEACVRLVTDVLDGALRARMHGGVHYVDVRAVAEAVVSAARLADPRPIYHLPGTAGSRSTFADQVARLSGATPPPRPLPGRLLYPLARASYRLAGRRSPLPDPVHLEMGRHWWGLETRFADELGFATPDGEQTLADTIEWVHSQRAAR